jgi:hypothetical protein
VPDRSKEAAAVLPQDPSCSSAIRPPPAVAYQWLQAAAGVRHCAALCSAAHQVPQPPDRLPWIPRPGPPHSTPTGRCHLATGALRNGHWPLLGPTGRCHLATGALRNGSLGLATQS